MVCFRGRGREEGRKVLKKGGREGERERERERERVCERRCGGGGVVVCVCARVRDAFHFAPPDA